MYKSLGLIKRSARVLLKKKRKNSCYVNVHYNNLYVHVYNYLYLHVAYVCALSLAYRVRVCTNAMQNSLR